MKLTIVEIREIVNILEDKMEEKKDYLIKLDSKLGDGDLGITLSKAFKAAKKSIEGFEGDDIGKALLKMAMSINNAASSTMGTLLSSGIMEAGKAVKGKEEITKYDIVDITDAVIKGIKKRGKAKKGDKTILDCFIPASRALKEKIKEDKSLLESLEFACKAAEKGVEETKDMVSQHGRARYYGEDSKGHKDPGAVAGLIIIKTIKNYME